MNSKEIVTEFLKRKDESGVVGLTRKQVSWLIGQLDRERLLPPGKIRGDFSIQNKEGEYFKLIVYPNGAGFIRQNHNEPSIFKRSYIDPEMMKEYIKRIKDLRDQGHELAASEIEKSLGIKTEDTKNE